MAEATGDPTLTRKVQEIMEQAEEALENLDQEAYEEALEQLENLIEKPTEPGEDTPVPEGEGNDDPEPEASFFQFSPHGEMSEDRFAYSNALYDGTVVEMADFPTEVSSEEAEPFLSKAGFGALHVACGAITFLARIIRPRISSAKDDKRAA